MERRHDPTRLNGALPKDTQEFRSYLDAAANHLSEPSQGYVRRVREELRMVTIILADGSHLQTAISKQELTVDDCPPSMVDDCPPTHGFDPPPTHRPDLHP